jgi:hypothetical protein
MTTDTIESKLDFLATKVMGYIKQGDVYYWNPSDEKAAFWTDKYSDQHYPHQEWNPLKYIDQAMLLLETCQSYILGKQTNGYYYCQVTLWSSDIDFVQPSTLAKDKLESIVETVLKAYNYEDTQ